MTKKLPTDAITSELSQSVFFHKPVGEQVHTQTTDTRREAEPHSPPPLSHEAQPSEADHQPSSEASSQAVKTDVTLDVMTSHFPSANLKHWQEIIENTETQNSALRLTCEERYAVEDAVNELRRQYGIKTSMNEIARLGLLLLIHDFKQHKKVSLIHQVKKV